MPNRGVDDQRTTNTDQFVVTLDYEQVVAQVAGRGPPRQRPRRRPRAAIHHEPGLFLHTSTTPSPRRTPSRGAPGTIPHGDRALALGRATDDDGERPVIPDVDGLPDGVPADLDLGYLRPYKHFDDNLFQGIFNPVHPAALLERGTVGASPFTGSAFDPAHEVVRTTKLSSTRRSATGGIRNIPFVTSQANAAEMRFTMWLVELVDGNGDQQLVCSTSRSSSSTSSTASTGCPVGSAGRTSASTR